MKISSDVNDIDENNFGMGRRFREERERLGFTQRGLATRLATTERTIITYETDATPPKLTKLMLFQGAGADLLYILTGQHAVGVLAPDEAALLDNYRAVSEERKGNLVDVAEALSQKQQAEMKAG